MDIVAALRLKLEQACGEDSDISFLDCDTKDLCGMIVSPEYGAESYEALIGKLRICEEHLSSATDTICTLGERITYLETKIKDLESKTNE